MRRFCGNRVQALGDQSGQALVLVAFSMVDLIGFVGLAIDVGNAYVTQRELQKAADAAALAGAQELPNAAAAVAVAQQYGAAAGEKNEATFVDDAAMTVSTRCVPSLGCTPSRGVTTNVIAVTETAQVPTLFAKVLGFDSFTVHAKATACSPCSAKPLDIMLVLDRTGSMCQLSLPSGVVPDPSCTDLNYAKDGVRTFVSYFDESLDRIGLAVFPPTPPNPTQAQKCASPAQANYNNADAAYVIEGLSNDFDPSSQLMDTVNCLQGNGTTAYADAIDNAQAELAARGRPEAQDVIVFLSDGAANTGGTWHTPVNTNPYRTTPCRQGVTSAGAAKAAGTVIYSIGYDLDGGTSSPEICRSAVTGGPEPGGITAYDAIQQIASVPENFYKRDAPGSLNLIFTAIATDISSLNARLVPDDVS
jgi:Flp pilus assembly protein TadG